jgi:hypothetical protein
MGKLLKLRAHNGTCQRGIHIAVAAHHATHDERRHGMENVKNVNGVIQRRGN